MDGTVRSGLAKAGRVGRVTGEWLRTFFPAESLRKYGDFGYFLLVIPLVLLNALLLSISPQMQQVLARLPVWGKFLVSILFETIPLPTEDEKKLTLGQLILVLYLFVWFSPLARRRIGEGFADFCCWIYEAMIAAAGWCIRHRWWSFLLVLVLFVALVWQINFYADQVAGHHFKKGSFDQWVSAAERAAAESRIDGSEAAHFLELMDQWDPQFIGVLTPEQFELTRHMHKFFITLYEGHNGRPWLRHLLIRREALRTIHSEARAVLVAAGDSQSLRMLNLMHLTMARIHIRMGQDDCSDLGMILAAHSFLKGVALDVAQPSFAHTAANAEGNIYNCLLSELIKGASPAITGETYAQLLAICSSHVICLERALSAYQGASQGAAPCSLDWRRKLNNEIDVKTKLALHFGTLPPTEDGERSPPWLRTADLLARELESKARELLECNRSEPFVPLVFVTAAQAFGAASALWPASSPHRGADLRAAGVLLRLSSSYRPRDLDDWNLLVFCHALEGDHIDPDFAAGIKTLPDFGSIDVGDLERSIRKRCRR